MRIWQRELLWGSATSAVLALSGCGADAPTDATTSQSATTRATAVITAPTTQAARTEKWVDLEVGECLADLPPSDPSMVTVTVVDCAAAHQAEVYFRAAVGVNAALAEVADRECNAGFSQYTGRSVDDSPFAVTYLIDSNQDRTSDNPDASTVICVLYAANGQPLTGSARR